MDTTPRVFSKLSIILFTAFGSTFFGSLLYSSNLKATNNSKYIVPSILFSIIYAILINKLTRLINIPIYYSFIPANVIGGLLLVGPFWNHQIGVIEHYEKRAIWGPLFALLFPIAVYFFFLIYYQNFNPFQFRTKLSGSEFGQASLREYKKGMENGKLVLKDSAANFYDLNIPLQKSSYFFTTKVEDVNTLYNYVDYSEGRFMSLCMRIPLSDEEAFDFSLFKKDYTLMPIDHIISSNDSIICTNYIKRVNDTITAKGTIALLKFKNWGYEYITQFTKLDKASADELSYSLINSIKVDSSAQARR